MVHPLRHIHTRDEPPPSQALAQKTTNQCNTRQPQTPTHKRRHPRAAHRRPGCHTPTLVDPPSHPIPAPTTTPHPIKPSTPTDIPHPKHTTSTTPRSPPPPQPTDSLTTTNLPPTTPNHHLSNSNHPALPNITRTSTTPILTPTNPQPNRLPLPTHHDPRPKSHPTNEESQPPRTSCGGWQSHRTETHFWAMAETEFSARTAFSPRLITRADRRSVDEPHVFRTHGGKLREDTDAKTSARRGNTGGEGAVSKRV